MDNQQLIVRRELAHVVVITISLIPTLTNIIL